MDEIEKIKKDLIAVFAAIYKIPGQYFIAGLVSYGAWEISKNGNPWAIILLIMAIFFFAIELLTPIATGNRLLDKLLRFFQ